MSWRCRRRATPPTRSRPRPASASMPSTSGCPRGGAGRASGAAANVRGCSPPPPAAEMIDPKTSGREDRDGSSCPRRRSRGLDPAGGSGRRKTTVMAGIAGTIGMVTIAYVVGAVGWRERPAMPAGHRHQPRRRGGDPRGSVHADGDVRSTYDGGQQVLHDAGGAAAFPKWERRMPRQSTGGLSLLDELYRLGRGGVCRRRRRRAYQNFRSRDGVPARAAVPHFRAAPASR
jgi:hypothetical protein